MSARIVTIRVSPGSEPHQFQIQLETTEGVEAAHVLTSAFAGEAMEQRAKTGAAKAALGRRLFEWLLPGRLGLAWGSERAAARNDRSLVVFQFLPNTSDVHGLPLGLLHDAQGFLFSKPTVCWQVEYCDLPSTSPSARPERPSVLLAWAKPDGLATFEPERHRRALQSITGLELEELPDATLATLRERCQSPRPFDIVHLLAHGSPGLVYLQKDNSMPRPLNGQVLAGALRGCQFAFLTVCGSATESASALSIGRQLLHQDGGNCTAVVACQGDLPQGEWEEAFVRSFYESLCREWSPALALADARSAAGDSAWHIPVLLTRRSAPARRDELASLASSSMSRRATAANPAGPAHERAAADLIASDVAFRRALATDLRVRESDDRALLDALRSNDASKVETVGLVAERLARERCESGQRREAEALFLGYCGLLPFYFSDPGLSRDGSGLCPLNTCHYPMEVEVVLARLYGRSPRFRRGDEAGRILGDRAFEFLAPDAPETGSLAEDMAEDAAVALAVEVGKDAFERAKARIAADLPKELRPDDSTLQEFCSHERKSGRPYYGIFHAAPSCAPRYLAALRVAEAMRERFGPDFGTFATAAPDQRVARIVLYTLTAMLRALSTR